MFICSKCGKISTSKEPATTQYDYRTVEVLSKEKDGKVRKTDRTEISGQSIVCRECYTPN